MTDGSGYQYKRNRYYDPTTGRFTQEDPAGLAGGLNAYEYANNDPISYSGPFGLCPFCPALALAGAGASTETVPVVGQIVGTGLLIVAGERQHGPLLPMRRLVPKTPFVLGGEFSIENLHSLRSIKAMRFYADLAVQIHRIPDGTQIRLKIVE